MWSRKGRKKRCREIQWCGEGQGKMRRNEIEIANVCDIQVDKVS